MSKISLYTLYITLYLIVIIAISIYHALKIKSVDEFLVAGRNVGFWRIIGSIIATSCGAAAFIARDLYQQYLKPEASQKQMLLISSYSVVIIFLALVCLLAILLMNKSKPPILSG